MRYCLSCRHLVADTPLCTSCGRSFGGSLCLDCRFLNPPGARLCGQCHSTNLLPAASSVAIGRMLRLAALLLIAFLLMRWVPTWSLWKAGLFFSLTGYRSPLVWIVDRGAVFWMPIVLLFLAVSAISGLMPGAAGQMFRSLMLGFFTGLIRFAFSLLGRFFDFLLRLLLSLFRGGGNKPKL